MNTVTSYRARVHKGRLILDVPTELPEGSEIDLVRSDVDTLEEMSEEERRELAAEVAASRADEAAGRFEDIEDLLKQLRRT
jgi:predicted HAD superfamily phosphohydrolase